MVFSDYRDMVDSYLKADSSEVFGNFSSEHASYIITRFLETAQNSVDILSGNFHDAFYDNISVRRLLQQTAARLHSQGGRIRLITIDEGTDVDAIRRIFNDINGLYPNTMEYIPAIYQGDEPLSHFLVTDAKRYRLEAPHDRFVADATPSVHAEVCCNNRERASELLNLFDNIWQRLSGR